MSFLPIIAKRRDGLPHTNEEIRLLVKGATNGSIPDYQLSAWLMAAYLNPLSLEETTELTLAMAESGQRLDLSSLPKPWVDKHSSGGVGDKTTIVLLPLMAACGLTVVKMSGRGLGITGGTIDKLACIPGFRVDLTPQQMIKQAQKIGCALTGQTPKLAPADGVLYALRDATETVRSIPLIAASILSKKIAGGAETILLDIKCGSGAFMETLEEARDLATVLEAIGERAGLRVKAEITDMSQPLGSCVGNALEVIEAVGAVQPAATGFMTEFCMGLVADILVDVQKAETREAAEAQVREAIASGRAKDVAQRWIAAQGGPKDFCEGPKSYLPKAELVGMFTSPSEGWVEKWDAKIIGELVRDLGGGRKQKTDEIDPAVGLVSFVQVGQQIWSGGIVAQVHVQTKKQWKMAEERLAEALVISNKPVEPIPTILER